MPTCMTCTYMDKWKDPGRCLADNEYHDYEDTCPFWANTLRDEPVKPPEVVLAEKVAKMDVEIED